MLADLEATETLFRKLFKGGDKLRRMPRNKDDAEVFLALAASVLDPQRVYTEPELGEALSEWMAGFTDLTRLDHVTVRRFLVDYRFLLRDPSGSAYRTNQAVINATIAPEARSVLPHRVFETAVAARAARRRQVTG